MSFLEWWGESADPGPCGEIVVAAEHEPCPYRWLVWLRFLAVLILLPIFWALAIVSLPLPLWQAAAMVIGGTMIYAGVGYLLDPRPDVTNLGWCEGLMDHPWRVSDDWNRGLIWLNVVLGPGRFVAESLLDARQLLAPRDEENPYRSAPPASGEAFGVDRADR